MPQGVERNLPNTRILKRSMTSALERARSGIEGILTRVPVTEQHPVDINEARTHLLGAAPFLERLSSADRKLRPQNPTSEEQLSANHFGQ